MKRKKEQKDLITYVDKPTHQVGYGVRAKVREHRPAQRQARQENGKRENRYVIKAMRLNKEGVRFPLRTKGCTEPFSLAVKLLRLHYLINPIM